MKPRSSEVLPGQALDQWILMPVIDCLEMTVQAIDDCLGQTGLPKPPRVLVIDNGSGKETRRTLEALQMQWRRRLLCWFHHPPLGGPPFGTLSASWNAGLDFAWACGAGEVLVVNNDLRLSRWTYDCLLRALRHTGALFVSAVGVTEEQFDPEESPTVCLEGRHGRGGPDFSCFVVSRECHHRFRFDEQFTYFNDNDYHHRLRLAGEDSRIFSVNVPYLHYGSATINRTDEVKKAYAPVFEEHRRRYQEKWGGLPGEETDGKAEGDRPAEAPQEG